MINLVFHEQMLILVEAELAKGNRIREARRRNAQVKLTQAAVSNMTVSSTTSSSGVLVTQSQGSDAHLDSESSTSSPVPESAQVAASATAAPSPITATPLHPQSRGQNFAYTPASVQ